MANFIGKPPKITVGGIPINEQTFLWQLSSGVAPYFNDFVVRKGELNDSIAALQNPTYLEMDVWGAVSGVPKNHRMKFEKIYLLEPKPIDDYFVQWSIADVRWSWRGKKVYKSWNKTRQENQFGLANNAPDTDPAILRQPFDTFAVGRYIPWSVKPDGKPYTVYEMMIELFSTLGIAYVEDPQGVNRSYVEENVQFDGVDVYKALATLCSKGRHSLYVGEDGKARAFSLDFYDENPQKSIQASQNTAKVSPGTLYRQDLSRTRPKYVTVLFEKMQEVRLIETPPEPETIDNPTKARAPIAIEKLRAAGLSNSDFDERRVIGCVNVIPVPLPITIQGRKYNIGEYATMTQYLNALGVSESRVRQLWFVPEGLAIEVGLKYYGSFATTIEIDLLQRKIEAAIKTHYRQTYMIDPHFVDQIESWETKRCAVIDNYSRFSPPSPCWIDYCLIPTARPVWAAQNRALFTTIAENWKVNQYDPNREKAATMATVVPVNKDLGVFKLSLPYDLSGIFSTIIPSAVFPLPAISPAEQTILWSQCELSSDHTFETLISVVWATDKNKSFSGFTKYYPFTFDYGSKFGTAKGPNIEFLCKKDYARLSTPTFDTDSATGTKAVNDDILSALAKSEAAKIIHQFQNRIVGAVTLTGFQRIEITGNIKAVGYSFSRVGGARTMLDLRDIPPTPTTEQNLDDETISFLHRQVDRAGSSNALK